MRHPIPPISEAVTALKERLPHEHDGRKKPRLQMLSWLASGQARTRQDVARRLGVHRNTMSQWLAVYAVGGLAALLVTSVPRGTPVSLAPEGLASLEQALRRPGPFTRVAVHGASAIPLGIPRPRVHVVADGDMGWRAFPAHAAMPQ